MIFFIIFEGWAFSPFNPWRQRFDVVIKMMKEAGLVDYYKIKTLTRMKKEYLESDEQKITFIEDQAIAPMSLEDFAGIFYFSGMVVFIAILTFFIELTIGYFGLKKNQG